MIGSALKGLVGKVLERAREAVAPAPAETAPTPILPAVALTEAGAEMRAEVEVARVEPSSPKVPEAPLRGSVAERIMLARARRRMG